MVERTTIETLLVALRKALAREVPSVTFEQLRPLGDTGLAHWHVALEGTGLLARIPKQSQMRLSAKENLAYQAACFRAAAESGHTPRLHALLGPSDDLPRGALIVDRVDGRPARLPDDLAAIATALAAIHRIPVPRPEMRAPLRDAADPLTDLMTEVTGQAVHLQDANLSASVLTAIRSGISMLQTLVDRIERPPRTLISFDAHPGNFLIEPDGRAVLVDLEKARFAYAGLDLAHATLYTSTTWDVSASAELSDSEVAEFYRSWNSAAGPEFSEQMQPWFVPLRLGMWLWSVTWCAKWRVLSAKAAKRSGDGEDWSAQNSDSALVAHVRDRVDHYLSGPIVERVGREMDALSDVFPTRRPLLQKRAPARQSCRL